MSYISKGHSGRYWKILIINQIFFFIIGGVVVVTLAYVNLFECNIIFIYLFIYLFICLFFFQMQLIYNNFICNKK